MTYIFLNLPALFALHPIMVIGKSIKLQYPIYIDYRMTQGQPVFSSDISKSSFPKARSPETTALLLSMKGHGLQRQLQHLSLKQKNPITFIFQSLLPSSLFLSSSFLPQQYIIVALSISCLAKLPWRPNMRQWDAANL